MHVEKKQENLKIGAVSPQRPAPPQPLASVSRSSTTSLGESR